MTKDTKKKLYIIRADSEGYSGITFFFVYIVVSSSKCSLTKSKACLLRWNIKHWGCDDGFKILPEKPTNTGTVC